MSEYVYEYAGADNGYAWTEVPSDLATAATSEGRVRDAEYVARMTREPVRIMRPAGGTTPYRVSVR